MNLEEIKEMREEHKRRTTPREIRSMAIAQEVADLCFDTNVRASQGMKDAIAAARARETSEPAKKALDMMIQNMAVAETEYIPMCQDTGMIVVFVDIGQHVRLTGPHLTAEINASISDMWAEGRLRASVVKDPFYRENTEYNDPAVVHYNIVEGNEVTIRVMPKGFGSENKSALKMLTPADGMEGVKKFVLDTVAAAGDSPCPPLIVGIGIGGTMEKAALLAKEALFGDITQPHPDPHWAAMEAELLEKINAQGVGVAGLGGNNTALGVNILTYATHIAGLPVAVNLSCHVARHGFAIL